MEAQYCGATVGGEFKFKLLSVLFKQLEADSSEKLRGSKTFEIVRIQLQGSASMYSESEFIHPGVVDSHFKWHACILRHFSPGCDSLSLTIRRRNLNSTSMEQDKKIIKHTYVWFVPLLDAVIMLKTEQKSDKSCSCDVSLTK